ncbi:uncharacterized protein BDV14DRAFT_197493 [Aspergillus stella-maris]|uniref:uncharacterized protein n=1 Tax=Aspergillus stella-maris TaxID=1810926 RepID=UPI003CCE0427
MTKNTPQAIVQAHGQSPAKPPYYQHPAALAFTILSLVLLVLFSYKSFTDSSFISPFSAPSQESLSDTSGSPDEEHARLYDRQPCPLPTTRYSIHTGQAACYPSSGGIWLSELGPLELQHLGLDRFSSTERPDISKEEEDAFCAKLRLFGGEWHNPDSKGEDLYIGGECHELCENAPIASTTRKVGIASDENDRGVWVLSVDEETGRFPDGIGIVKNALTMEERVQALIKLGAVYCADVEECSFLGDLKLEPRELPRDKAWEDVMRLDYL